MTSRTRTPDLPAVSGLVTPPATAEPSGPPEAPATGTVSEARGTGTGGAGTGGAGTGGEPAWGGLRLVAVPDGWPPYDCETHGAACSAAAPVAAVPWDAIPASAGLPLDARTAEAAADRTAGPSPALGRAAGAGSTPHQSGGTGAGPGGGTGHTPEVGAAWLRQFALVLIEILAGFRPAKQLAPWATERARAQIDLLSRAADAEQRPRIRRVMTSRPTAGVVEMTMVVGFGPRSRALAMRFEHVPARPPVPGRPARPARWLCTEIETS
jgi:hypothetical protein